MKLDKLTKPETLWYENEQGEKIDWDIRNMVHPECYYDGGVYQYSQNVVVTQSICRQYQEPHWIVRTLYWLIRKMPDKWQKISSQVYESQTTINSSYKIIKYLVEQRNFSFSDACIISSRLCERCCNVCECELAGQQYNSWSNTHCDYCKVIDPDYDMKHKLWCCYRTFKLDGDVAKAYKNVSVYSDETYMKKHRVDY